MATTTVPAVPFYSQFNDITSPTWKKAGCGITSLAMIIDYYKTAVPVDTLLKQGLNNGAYIQNVGWSYKGLIDVSQQYGLDGDSYDLGTLTPTAAYTKMAAYLKNGPVIVSVHYKFDPKSTIPHLVVLNGVDGGSLHYNDPAAKSGDKQISIDDFLKGWKRRFIVLRPVVEKADTQTA